MHPMSHVLAEMVARAATRQRRPHEPVDAKGRERAIVQSLGELYAVRPRIVTFAPAIALKRVLSRHDLRPRVADR